MLSFQTLKKRVVEQFEVSYLRDLMELHRGSVTEAAKDAQMDRANFHRLLRRYEITPSIYRPMKNEESISQTA